MNQFLHFYISFDIKNILYDAKYNLTLISALCLKHIGFLLHLLALYHACACSSGTP